MFSSQPPFLPDSNLPQYSNTTTSNLYTFHTETLSYANIRPDGLTREEFLERLENELKRMIKERKKKNAQALLMRPPPAPVPVQPASRAPVLLLRARGQAPRKPK